MGIKDIKKNYPQVYTSLPKRVKGENKYKPQVYTTQEGIEEIKNYPQVHTTEKGISESKNYP